MGWILILSIKLKFFFIKISDRPQHQKYRHNKIIVEGNSPALVFLTHNLSQSRNMSMFLDCKQTDWNPSIISEGRTSVSWFSSGNRCFLIVGVICWHLETLWHSLNISLQMFPSYFNIFDSFFLDYQCALEYQGIG